MKRIPVIVLCAAAVLAVAIPSFAHDEFGFVGTLTAVDLAKDRVALRYKDNGKDDIVKLFLTARTKVVDKDKKSVPRASLKNGLTAVVTAFGDDGDEELEALLIRIVPAPAAK